VDKIARAAFNASFTKEKYQALLAEIESEFPSQLDFRVAESPIFVHADLKIKLLKACNEIINSISSPDFIEKTNSAIPATHFVSGENARPDCLAIDFAICKNEEGDLEPKLIELQAFPSLFGYQSYLSSKYKKYFTVPNSFSPYFNRLNAVGYIEEMRKFLLGNSKAEHVILLEIFPEKQKTRLDFAITKTFWGIETVCVTKLIQEGKDIFYKKDNQKIKVERIYNRLIFDDLDNNFENIKLNIDFKSDWNVTWISHPNWFYRVSKFCMPFLKSASVPETKFLSDFKPYPENLSDYVLKPLFSFAGAGINLDVKKEDLDKITDPGNYILQKKVIYEPCIEDVNGEKIKCEIRMLYIWPAHLDKPKLITNLTRLSRGKMIGVAFNKDFDWVGGSSAFFETA
jgi:hypothetical protein